MARTLSVARPPQAVEARGGIHVDRPLRHDRLGGTQLGDVLAATLSDGKYDLVALGRLDHAHRHVHLLQVLLGRGRGINGLHHVSDHLGISLSRIGTPTLQIVGLSAGPFTAAIAPFYLTRILISMLLSMLRRLAGSGSQGLQAPYRY